MLRNSTMKQNNLLRVYMKLEQYNHLRQMRVEDEGQREGVIW
jgi:hypothetical protein